MASECLKSFKLSKFDVLESYDLDKYARSRGQLPWHASLKPNYSFETIQHTYWVSKFIDYLVWFLEKIWLAPKGTSAVHQTLFTAAKGLCASGDLQIFTPMYLVVARKPNKSEKDK